VTHYWETTPNDNDDEHPNNNNTTTTWWTSTGLYLDQLRPNANGWGDYQQTQKLIHMKNPPTAIVVATFELSTDFWINRNVLGRLLAISMGASSSSSAATTLTEPAFVLQYQAHCQEVLGWEESLCRLVGAPLIDSNTYTMRWKETWKQWKALLCDQLTYETEEAQIVGSTTSISPTIVRQANACFWNSMVLPTTKTTTTTLRNTMNTAPNNNKNNNNNNTNSNVASLFSSLTTSMEHTGIVLDLVQDWIPPEGLQTLFQTLLQPLGFDLVQLRLANDYGMVVDWESVPGMPYHRNHNDNDTSTRSYYYTPMDLRRIAGVANEVGLQVVPELSVATNAGGWYKAGGVFANCPKTLCQRGHGIAHNVLGDNAYDTTTTNFWLPIVLAVLHELRHL
jgi:hypothetical protein